MTSPPLDVLTKAWLLLFLLKQMLIGLFNNILVDSDTKPKDLIYSLSSYYGSIEEDVRVRPSIPHNRMQRWLQLKDVVV